MARARVFRICCATRHKSMSGKGVGWLVQLRRQKTDSQPARAVLQLTDLCMKGDLAAAVALASTWAQKVEEGATDEMVTCMRKLHFAKK